jgi:hypothetical protein
MFHLFTLALYSAIFPATGYYLYRAALPKPIPGIPHNELSAKRLFGDSLDAIGWHKRTGDTVGWTTKQLLKHDRAVVQLFMRKWTFFSWI